MMGARIGVAMVVMIAGTASAQDIPRYDVAKHCGSVAAAGGGAPSEVIRNGCFQMEQSAYNGLKPLWAGLPQAMRKHCDMVASVGGGGSYSILQGCINMEQSASSQTPGFKY
ncbi:hypothetical protein D3877_13015 [Azospirillum cavernae]|uniref:Uncharacterized protein n=1 Tax=Azospirillum cavernae TaxID=2320860 RepID=A0A418VVG0_9PROT|nr:hypothetical protein [Azospirillum cavernae]RJF81137.1 hypothetical protein D3877_13015 [Azospirillum cavernae]